MLDRALMGSAIRAGSVVWRRHALERMLSREISRGEVGKVLLQGEQIEDYTAGFPFPSGLFLGTVRDRKIHVVAALDTNARVVHVISAYEPDETHFEPDMKIRRRKP